MKPFNYAEYLADKQDRPAFRRARALCMMPADAASFSDQLKAAFPAIRFVSVDYWQHFVDQQRWEAECREHRRRAKLGLPNIELRRHMRDPTGEPLHYWGSLADPAERRFYVWVEPAGWRPVWGPANEDGVRYIENTPRLWFEFRRSQFQHNWPRGVWYNVELPHASRRDCLVLSGPQFTIRWNPSEPEAEAFGKKVYNILRKLTACEFKVFEPESRRAYDAKTWRMQKQCLAGHHALAWSLKRRHNYLKCENWEALLKSADCRFRPGDVFTPGELKQWQADRDAEFEAELAQLLEKRKQQARERARSGKPPEPAILVHGTGALSGLDMRIPIGTSKPRNRR
jgi:hypothetical protein